MVGGAFAGLGQVASGASKFCFVAGTQVLTKDGHKNIEDVKVGEIVPCVNEFTGEYGEKKVTDLSVLETNKFVKLIIGGEEIICTPEHPFSVKGKGFIEAGNLKQGDLVHNKDFEALAVEKVEHFETKVTTKVYNFTVEDNHTYFVGNNCLIVHNAGPCNVNKMNKEIQTGKAPRGVERIDKAKVKGEQIHAHLNKGSAINFNGTLKHGTGKELTRDIADWLKLWGWNL